MRYPVLIAASLLLLSAGAAIAQPGPKRIRGTIQKLDGNTLTVVTTGGETDTIVLASNYTVNAILPTTLDKVHPGAKIGIVGFGPPAQQRAAVISVFPEGANFNEVQFPWDTAPDSMMTNGPITSEVASTDGRQLTVTVKGQPVQVSVPPGAIIQTSEPGTPAMLTPGAKVMIFAQQNADGTLSAPRVSVGKDGFTPGN